MLLQAPKLHWQQNSLKNYLDDRLRTAIVDYRKATEPDLYKVKASMLQVEDHLNEVRLLAGRIQKSKERFLLQPNKNDQNQNNSSGKKKWKIHTIDNFVDNFRIKGLVDAV